ncbi:MAG: NADH-quinone oxidoreductase subunit NuoE [Bacteroidales bacterium]
MSFHPTMPYESGELHKSERVLPDEGAPFTFTPDNRKRIEEIASHYPPERRRSAIIPTLHIVQEQQGYVSAAAMREVATVIGCTPAEVEDVVSYYSMFYTKPVGKYVLQVCRTLSCALMGAERLTDAICRKLNIRVGETDATGTFTLVEVECLGACDRGPVVMVNDHWHELATPDSVDTLLDTLRTKGEQGLSGCHLNVDKREPTLDA